LYRYRLKEQYVQDQSIRYPREFASLSERIVVGCLNSILAFSSIVLRGRGGDIVDSLKGFVELCPWSKSAQGATHVDVADLEAVDIAGVNPTKARKVSQLLSGKQW
jgi:hypothetical protein